MYLEQSRAGDTDNAQPRVTIGARTASDGSVTFEIADERPGMPAMERGVLEEGNEAPMFHARGLGLWVARTLIVQAGGAFHVVDTEPRGTVVRLSLPPNPDSR